MAICTPFAAPASLKVLLPPMCRFPLQGADRGTVVSLVRPVSEHCAVSAPRMPWIFLLRNSSIGGITTTAEFFAAAISAVFELGAAGDGFGRPPRPGISSRGFFAPIWSL